LTVPSFNSMTCCRYGGFAPHLIFTRILLIYTSDQVFPSPDCNMLLFPCPLTPCIPIYCSHGRGLFLLSAPQIRLAPPLSNTIFSCLFLFLFPPSCWSLFVKDLFSRHLFSRYSLPRYLLVHLSLSPFSPSWFSASLFP